MSSRYKPASMPRTMRELGEFVGLVIAQLMSPNVELAADPSEMREELVELRRWLLTVHLEGESREAFDAMLEQLDAAITTHTVN